MDTKKIKIYILGASGFLGSRCADYFRLQGFQVFDNRVDILNPSGMRDAFSAVKPDVVINLTGAKAYPTIDWCEDHKEETVRVNVVGATNVMLAALEAGAYPIQISSGCVYNGGPEREFTEEDEPNFHGSFYSRMRIVLQDILNELPVLYARIRMPISKSDHPRNLINKIVSYSRVISIPNSVTLIEDLWPALGHLIETRPFGILNLTNEGYVEHQQILEAYKKIVDPGHEYELISLEQLEGSNGIIKAKRSNCVLSMKKAKSLGISMPKLTDKRIEDVMRVYKSSLKQS
ncbi:MAG: sugar nucleotide-binding protein [Candidatus Yanofskybacteria bacterium]|nr:sugar nucleotide-binding protein [Candidatus Yanofskybacteria bacterium]